MESFNNFIEEEDTNEYKDENRSKDGVESRM